MSSSLTIRLTGLAMASESGETSVGVPEEFGVSDDTLMAQICEGSGEALAVLFRRHARRVRGVAYRVLRDSSEADDLLQDVFLLVQRDCRTFDSTKSPARFWILQMAHRRAISRRRYLNSRHFYTQTSIEEEGRELQDPGNGVFRPYEESVEGILGTGRLQSVFNTLSEDQRETLRLFFFEGYTLNEIAAKLGQSRGNIKHYYFRGLDRLRKELFGSKLPTERAV
jgi:RNA polymerase sigma-70 factor (ECF subfamily)